MNVDHFIEEAKAVSQALNTEIEIIRGKELDQKGFGGIYGVGKAASCPPALVILKHTPPDAKKRIAWVGKGIVYDTGGLSLKGRVSPQSFTPFHIFSINQLLMLLCN